MSYPLIIEWSRKLTETIEPKTLKKRENIWTEAILNQ